MITSFRNIHEFKKYILDNNVTIMSGMHRIKGDATGVLIDSMIKSGYEICIATGFYEGKHEPSVIIPNISVSTAIKLGIDYGQEMIIHDGIAFSFGEHNVHCKQLNFPAFWSPENDSEPSKPYTEVILEDGEKARLRYS